MRILHVYKDYYPPTYGGVEVTIHTLAQGTRDAGGDVTVLIANRRFRSEQREIQGIPVVKVADLGRVLSAPLPPTFPLWLRRLGGGILHFHLPNPTAVGSYFMASPRGKVVVHYHSDIVRQHGMERLYRSTLRRFLRRADAIIATSPNYVETSPILRDFRDKCRIIPLAADENLLKPDEKVEERARIIRERYGERPIILFVGVLRYYKGTRYLIEAMRGIPANLLIVGNGPLFRDLVDLRDRLGLRKSVFFMGHVPDIRPYSRAADLFCLPATHRSEAFGVVLLEAMMHGLPLVTTDLPTGVSYVNQADVTGLQVPIRDPESLREALGSLAADPERRKEMGEAGRRRVRDVFSREQMIGKVLDLYRELES
jgi:rhamnosyl/mannosyltransferase